jgi:hypothetical protein
LSWLAGIIGEDGLPRFARPPFSTREEALAALETIAEPEVERVVGHDIQGHVTVFNAERSDEGEWVLTPYPKL